MKNLKRFAPYVLASLLLAAVSAQGAVTSDFRIPLTGLQAFNACNGETVTATSGFLHIVAATTTDSAGGLHLDFHVNGENIKAVGDSTGATYASNDSQNNHLNFNAGGTTNTTATTTFHLISHDQSVPSFTLHALFHLTINPDGTLTAFVNSFTPSCK